MMMIIDTRLVLLRKLLKLFHIHRLSLIHLLVASAVERANVGKALSEAMFEYVGSQVPMDKALSIVSNFATDDMSISSDMLDELKERQAKLDELSQRKQELEIEKLEKEISLMGTAGRNRNIHLLKSSSGSSTEKKEGYSRIEQKQHEKTKS